MCDAYLDPCEFWSETDRKARKPRRCSCCARTIQPGETYTAHFSKFEGDVTTGTGCAECVRDRKAFATAHAELTPTFCYFPHMLAECVAENDPDDERWKPMLDRINANRRAAHG